VLYALRYRFRQCVRALSGQDDNSRPLEADPFCSKCAIAGSCSPATSMMLRDPSGDGDLALHERSSPSERRKSALQPPADEET